MIVPAGVIRPIAGWVPASVNHMLPSGPRAIPPSWASLSSPALNSVIVPAGVIRPIAGWVPASVNHMFPSGPDAIACGRSPVVSPALNCLIVPSGSAAAEPLPKTTAIDTASSAMRLAIVGTLPVAPGAACRRLIWVPARGSRADPIE